jgi:hypothetical protein
LARQIRGEHETQTEIKRQAHAQIEEIRFKLFGATQYPDATSSLRLSYGAVRGYQEGAIRQPYTTTFAGLYARSAEHNGTQPYDLPSSWRTKKLNLDTKKPLNFVSTADIIGGNSGSPVVNRAGQFVGIIFDGNIQSLVLDYVYSEEQARAEAVDARGIVEGLKNIYGARSLVSEWQSGKMERQRRKQK